MPQNKATILGVAINSTSASSVLKEIGQTASRDVILSETKNPDNDKGVTSKIVSPISPTGSFAKSDLAQDDREEDDKKYSLIVFTPNPEFLVEASRDLSFRDLLNKADINLPDGIGLVWASRLLGCPISQRVSGADVAEGLLKIGNRKWEMRNEGEKCEVGREVGSGDGNEKRVRWVIGIAGARRGVLEESRELVKKLQEKFPNISFVNLDDPNLQFTIYNLQSNQKFQISNSRPPGFARQSGQVKFQIVFACHGMKKQENWIWENKNKYNANVFMGVGGSLDFLGGFSKRAPKIMRIVGLEWLWRGLQKPSHFKRIWKATVLFGWMVIKERLRIFNFQ